jgi:oxygen-independent coproporphyrinogen-3 oxidase
MSIGVQDLSDAVQKAIGRIESYGHIAETIKLARSVGFKSINCDLVYGLPHQTVGSFGETIKKMIALDPDRLACFNFAYLPASMPHQSGISSRDMPRPREKLEILCRTIEALGQAGYDFIGMDHFAKRTDELSLAARNGTLWRNFQGYTTKAGTNLIGFGMTAISDVNECYAQNAKTLDGYHSAIDSGRLATVKGWRLSKEDVRRRDIIRDIFCGQGLFLRNIAAQFDEYLGEDGKIFSRAI